MTKPNRKQQTIKRFDCLKNNDVFCKMFRYDFYIKESYNTAKNLKTGKFEFFDKSENVIYYYWGSIKWA